MVRPRGRCRSNSWSAANLGAKFEGKLQGFATIFLLNVKELGEQDWNALNSYVREGGGLVVAPGHLSVPASYNQPTASQLLPVQLGAQPHIAKPETKMSTVTNLTHPLFERYGKDLATVLGAFPVYKYWPVQG